MSLQELLCLVFPATLSADRHLLCVPLLVVHHLVVPQALKGSEGFLTKFTGFLVLNFSRVDPFVSLEMSPFSKLVRTLLTLKPGLSVVELVSHQGAAITEKFPTEVAADPLLVMDDPDMPGEMVSHLVHLITVGAGEATDIRISQTVNLGHVGF